MPTGKKNLLVQVEEYLALALMLPIATLVGYGMGYLLDRAFGTTFLRIVFLLLGVISGFVQILRQLTRASRNAGS
ncbi:MAG TPA: AtpZ/AtpI family protein [Candidatus Sulfopaludibacter sp.]|nr:AtpZ/AtpI family protein [Candidatus Sulfopaludibacter sp.]